MNFPAPAPPRPAPPPLPRARRGIAVVVALAFLLVAGVIGIGLHALTRSRKGQAADAYTSECLHQACLSACRAAAQHYLARMNDPGDELCKRLREPDAFVRLPPFTPDRHEGMAALAADFPGLRVSVKTELSGLLPLSTPSPDPLERRGAFEFEAESSWRGRKKTVYLKRPFLVANVVPAGVCRFTLALFDAAAENWNLLDARADGTAGADRPFVLVNGDGASPNANGWIYLGGGRVGLNLGRGVRNFGEDFMLPPTVTRSPFFPNQRYALLHLNLGFSAECAREPVFARFPVKDVFKSSVLRLFGCLAAGDEASPTLVVGDVWRRYVQGAAVAPLEDGALARVIPMPWVLDREGVPTEPGFPPFLFLSQKLYQIYMSQVREEPCNRSFDFLLSCGKQPTPLYCKSLYRSLFPDVYPLVKPRLEIVTAQGALHYKGRLEDLRLERELAPRRAAVWESPADFLAGEGGERHLALDGVHFVKGKPPYDLGADGKIRYSGRACLVFDGDVKVGALEPVSPGSDFLAVVALKGDLRLAAPKARACLAAPAGEVRLPPGAELEGFLAARRLDPQALRKGGTLVYDMRVNPEGPGFKEFYVAGSAAHVRAFFEK